MDALPAYTERPTNLIKCGIHLKRTGDNDLSSGFCCSKNLDQVHDMRVRNECLFGSNSS